MCQGLYRVLGLKFLQPRDNSNKIHFHYELANLDFSSHFTKIKDNEVSSEVKLI